MRLDRLFKVLVLDGALLVAGTACTGEPDTGPDPQDTNAQADADTDADADADADTGETNGVCPLTCDGLFSTYECSAESGVMCCWGWDPCTVPLPEGTECCASLCVE